MKILFSALHFASFRNFESVVRDLAAHGHRIHLMADEPETFGGEAFVGRLASEFPSISWGWAPPQSDEPWFPFAQKVRYALDYVRFLDPMYARAEKLRLRNINRAPRLVRWCTGTLGRLVIGSRAMIAVLTWLERAMPRSRAMEACIAAQAPDVVLLTSLTFSRTSALEQLKACRALGIPTAACILSWDHLSSKALLHMQPDLTLVWNEVQRQEAVTMHRIPADRVVVTGAQCYDQWFGRAPSRSREAFCQAMGLDPGRPYVLYVCSTMSPVPDPIEPRFVASWIDALRSSGDPALEQVGILIRPHPERVKEWAGVSLDGLEHVVVHGRLPIDASAKDDYFDSLYHSAAVVGLCTSAFLEAAIIGRPVLTLLLPPYRMHQDGMAHFRYLLEVEGGLLHTAPDVPAHLRQLSEALAQGGTRDERNVRFLTAFIRPQGLEHPATPRFVDAVEHLATSPRTQGAANAVPGLSTALVSRLALATRSGLGHWLLMDAVDSGRAEDEAERARLKEDVLSSRAAYVQRKAEAKARAAEAKLRETRAKEWAKRARGWSTRKQIARLKGRVKALIGA